MNTKIQTHTLPARYASYLVNRDMLVFDVAINPDGKKDFAELEHYLSVAGIDLCNVMVSTNSEGETMEPYFMHGPIGPQREGGDALDFEFSVKEFEYHE